MAVKDCKSCGARLDIDDKYCPACGATVDKKEDPRVKYDKFYLNGFTSGLPRRMQMGALLGIVGMCILLVVLLLCGLAFSDGLLKIVAAIIFVPLIIYSAILGCFISCYWFASQRTNYFTIKNDHIDMSLGFKRIAFTLSDIKEIVPANNMNPKKGAISFGRKATALLPKKVLAFIGQNDKVLFYSVDSPEIFELFDYLGFSVPRVYFGNMA